MNAAIEQSQKATDQMLRGKAAEKKLELFDKTQVDKAKTLFKEYTDAARNAGFDMTRVSNDLKEGKVTGIGFAGDDITRQQEAAFNVAISRLELTKNREIYKLLAVKSAAEVATKAFTKSAIELLPKQFLDEENGAGGRERRMRDLYEKEYIYIREINLRKQDNLQLEEKMNRYLVDGTENQLEERLQAADSYYYNLQEIANRSN